MGKYLIKVYGKIQPNVLQDVKTMLGERNIIDLSLAKRINQPSELTFSVYYRDPALVNQETGEFYLRYNTVIQLLRVRKNGSFKDEGYFIILDRELSDETITFKAYGVLSRLNDYIFSPFSNLKTKTLDVALKDCLYKHVIERTWTWKEDWDGCVRSNVNTELLKGPDYGDAVCLAWDPNTNIFVQSGYLITEGIHFNQTPSKIKIRIKATTTEETETWFNYDFKSIQNPNWHLDANMQSNWQQILYQEPEGASYHEIEISGNIEGRITDLRVGVVLKTYDSSSKMEIDGITYYGKSPVLYAIQVVAIYESEFLTSGIPSTLNIYTIDTDITTSQDTTNLRLLSDLLDKYKLEITTDTFTPTIPVNIDGTPAQIGNDKTAYITLVEGAGRGDIISAPVDESYDNFANVLYVWGAGQEIDTYFIKVTNYDSINTYSDVYGSYTNSDLSDRTKILDEAEKELENRSKPQNSFRIEVIPGAIEDLDIGGEELTDVELGDYIDYFSGVRGIDDVFRVVEITKDSKGATLVLENKQANLLDEILQEVVFQQGIVPAPFNLKAEGGIIDG